MKYRVVLKNPVGHIIVDPKEKEDIRFTFFQNGSPHYMFANHNLDRLDQMSKYSEYKYLTFGCYMKREISDIKVENGKSRIC